MIFTKIKPALARSRQVRPIESPPCTALRLLHESCNEKRGQSGIPDAVLTGYALKMRLLLPHISVENDTIAIPKSQGKSIFQKNISKSQSELHLTDPFSALRQPNPEQHLLPGIT